jgi:hypothetical protein
MTNLGQSEGLNCAGCGSAPGVEHESYCPDPARALDVLNHAITYGTQTLTDERLSCVQVAMFREKRFRETLEEIAALGSSPLLSDMAQDVLRRTAVPVAQRALEGRNA